MPISNSTPNIPRQLVIVNSNPPSTGAQMGAKPCTQLNMEKNLERSFPE